MSNQCERVTLPTGVSYTLTRCRGRKYVDITMTLHPPYQLTWIGHGVMNVLARECRSRGLSHVLILTSEGPIKASALADDANIVRENLVALLSHDPRFVGTEPARCPQCESQATPWFPGVTCRRCKVPPQEMPWKGWPAEPRPAALDPA